MMVRRAALLAVVDGPGGSLAPLRDALAPCADHLRSFPSLRALPTLGSADVVVVDADVLEPGERPRAFFAEGGPRRVVLASRFEREQLAQAFGPGGVTNLLAKGSSPLDVALTVRTLLGEPWAGAEAWVPAPSEAMRCAITSSTQKRDVIAGVARFAAAKGLHPRLGDALELVADELFTNAVYNAPVDADGRPRFRALTRSVDVQLLPGEVVDFELRFGGGRLALAVRDPFGSLTRERMVGYFARHFESGVARLEGKSGGAGVGLHQVFESATQLVVSLEAGRRTEVVALFDSARSYRDFASRGKSLNVFGA